MRPNDLEERLISFTIDVLKFTDTLESSEHGRIYHDQLSRSSSSVTLNYGEARGAESVKDFIHKLNLTTKELRESFMSLRIIKGKNLTTDPVNNERLIKECNELISIFIQSIHTSEKRLRGKK